MRHPFAKSTDLRCYGAILKESPERLDIFLTAENLDKLHDVKQAWVSKYVEAGVLCFLHLDRLGPGGGRWVIIQQGSHTSQQRANKATEPSAGATSLTASEGLPFEDNKTVSNF